MAGMPPPPAARPATSSCWATHAIELSETPVKYISLLGSNNYRWGVEIPALHTVSNKPPRSSQVAITVVYRHLPYFLTICGLRKRGVAKGFEKGLVFLN